MSATVCWGSTRNRDCILYPGKGTVVLIRPAQTFYERIIIGSGDNSKRFRDSSAYQESLRVSNIYYLGFREYLPLPAYNKFFDVCLMPYDRNHAYVDSINPAKLNQYLAAGKPVVSTAIPEAKRYQDVVYIGRDHEDFVRMVATALQDDNQDSKQRRINVARKNSLEHRADQAYQLIKEACQQ